MLIRSLLISIWYFFDPFYFSVCRLHHICPNQKHEGAFRVRLTKYKGKEVLLSDGIKICKNDLLLKIHLHNVKLLKEFSSIRSELSKGRGMFKRVLESMPLLAAFIQNHPEGAKIKGIIGITLINKGFQPLGFECLMPKSKIYAWFKKTGQLPILLLSSSTFSLKSIKKHHPVYLFMSKEKLMDMYKRPV